MRWVVGLLVVALSLLVSVSAAQAAVVRDGETFSIDLGEARICFVSPIDLQTEDDCVGMKLSAAGPQDIGKRHHLAAGIIRAPGSRTSPRLFGLVQAYRDGTALTRELTDENSKEFAELITKAASTKLAPGQKLKPPISRLEKRGDMTMLRVSLDIDGPSPNPDDEIAEAQRHTEILGVFLRDASYFVEWKGASQSAIAMAHLADAALATIRVDPKMIKAPVEAAQSSSSLLFPIGIVVGLGLVAMLVVGLLLRKKGSSGEHRKSGRLGTFHAELWPPHDS
jgi:hypothetical protein